MTDRRFARQILAFGEEGQKRISATKVGMVGLGGMGSHMVQSLAYLGIEHFTLIDDDRVEITNLNRLVGATLQDVEQKSFKVDVSERVVRQVNPSALIKNYPYNLRTKEVIEALLQCGVLFCCVDHDSPRLILTELAAAYEIPLIDSATEIFAENHDFGGRTIVAQPGDFCTLCANQIDLEQAKWELSSPEERAFRVQHGYGLGEETPSPSVIYLNGVIANLAVAEFTMMVTGQRTPNRKLTYDGTRGIVKKSTDEKKSDCYICNYLVGQREDANIMRYVRGD